MTRSPTKKSPSAPRATSGTPNTESAAPLADRNDTSLRSGTSLNPLIERDARRTARLRDKSFAIGTPNPIDEQAFNEQWAADQAEIANVNSFRLLAGLVIRAKHDILQAIAANQGSVSRVADRLIAHGSEVTAAIEKAQAEQQALLKEQKQVPFENEEWQEVPDPSAVATDTSAPDDSSATPAPGTTVFVDDGAEGFTDLME